MNSLWAGMLPTEPLPVGSEREVTAAPPTGAYSGSATSRTAAAGKSPMNVMPGSVRYWTFATQPVLVRRQARSSPSCQVRSMRTCTSGRS